MWKASLRGVRCRSDWDCLSALFSSQIFGRGLDTGPTSFGFAFACIVVSLVAVFFLGTQDVPRSLSNLIVKVTQH
jgi:hypothetical protein